MSVTDVQRNVNLLLPDLRPIVLSLQADCVYHNIPMKIFETIRTPERQQYLFKQGTSKTLLSKHLEGKACDFVVFINNNWSWGYEHFYRMFGALTLKYPTIIWGGQAWSNWDSKTQKWIGFVDLPHIQLRG